MNWSFVLFFSFAGFAAIECLTGNETLGEMLEAAAHLEAQLAKSIANYERLNYTTFAANAHRLDGLVSGRKERLSKLQIPLNATMDSANPEVKKVFADLAIESFLLPVLIDPLKLGDAFKVDALLEANQKRNADDEDADPSPEFLEASVFALTQDEAKFGRDYSKVIPFVDGHYHLLGEPKGTTLVLVSGASAQIIKTAVTFCDKNPKNCSLDLVKLLEQFEIRNTRFQKLMPFSKPEMLKEVQKVLDELVTFKNFSGKLQTEEKITCDLFTCVKK